MTVEELYQSTGVVHDTDCAICDLDTSNRKILTEMLLVLASAVALLVTGIIALTIVGSVSIGIYKLGYFMARGLEWKSPPEIQMYEKYLYYKQYEDGSYEATLKDNTKVTGCIAGALCRE